MNHKYTPTQEKFIRDHMHLNDRMLRAEFLVKFGWAPTFAGMRKKRQRMRIERNTGYRTSSLRYKPSKSTKREEG